MSYDLLTIGDAAVDQFLKIHDATLHCDLNHKECEISFRYAEKIPVEEFRTSASGNSVNVAVGAATMGLTTQIYSEIGNDVGADLIIKTLQDKKVSTDFVFKNEGTYTDTHPIIVFQGERTIFTYHATRNYEIREWPKSKFIYYTSVGESYKHFQPKILKYMQENEDTILAFNPGSAQLKHDPDSIREILKKTDVIFINKEEAQLITEIKGNTKALHTELTRLGAKLSVITDSVNGASAFDGKEYFEIGICVIGDTQDKTGAGDAFASGFISALKYGKSSEEALKWGTINSAKKITVPGSTNGLASKQDVEEILPKVVFSKPNL